MENLTPEEWDQLSSLISRARGGNQSTSPKRAQRKSKKHVEIVEPEEEPEQPQPKNRSGLGRKPAVKAKGYAAWKSQRSQAQAEPEPSPEPTKPVRKRQPKPTFNGSSLDLPQGGTKSAKKIFQTTIMKEAYKLVQDHPELKGKQGAKLRLNICTKAMKAFEPVYMDPNFMFFIQDPDSCKDLIEDFAAELENQLG